MYAKNINFKNRLLRKARKRYITVLNKKKHRGNLDKVN